MAYTKEELKAIWKSTDGKCHLCWKKVRLKSYAAMEERDGWEVDHSNPRAAGGSERKSNFKPACISCNRSKGAGSTRGAQRKNGYRRGPKSAKAKRAAKDKAAAKGGLAGAVFGGALFGPAGALICGALGAAAGHSTDPEDDALL